MSNSAHLGIISLFSFVYLITFPNKNLVMEDMTVSKSRPHQIEHFWNTVKFSLNVFTRVFLIYAILAFLPILCEILASYYFSNRKMLKFDKEITKVQMLKYIILNCSCEYFTTQ